LRGRGEMFLFLLSYLPGVPIFFLISGFLIVMSYENNSNIKEYIKNRILRIYPALYVNIFIGLSILYYYGFIAFNFEFFRWLIAQMSIIQFYNAEMFREFGTGVINGSFWTILVELIFYIILPFLLYFYKKNIYIPILLAICSYGIYIYHMLIINIFIQIGFVGEIRYFIGAIFLSIIFGVTSWFLIEKPFLKFKKHSLFRKNHN
jgi:peptidoglycan/LPS O-acetylase OafA/YrhL